MTGPIEKKFIPDLTHQKVKGVKLTGEQIAQNTIDRLKTKINTGKDLRSSDKKLAASLGLIVPKKENPIVQVWNVVTNGEGQKTFEPNSKKVAQFAEIHNQRQTFKDTQTKKKADVEFHQKAINGVHEEIETALSKINREKTGATFSASDKEITFPVDKKALFENHDQLTKLKQNLAEAEDKLKNMQTTLKTSSSAESVFQQEIVSIQNQVKSLRNQIGTKREAIKDILLKHADNQALEEKFDIHTKGVKDSEAQIDLARKMLEANAESGGQFIGRKPVPPANPTTPTTPTTPPVVTEEVAQSKVQKLLDGIKKKHGLNDISGDSEVTLTDKDGKKVTKQAKDITDEELNTAKKIEKTKEWHNDLETFFNGKRTEENPAVFGNFTFGGISRSVLALGLGFNVIDFVWNKIFGKKEQPTAADLAFIQAQAGRGRAV